MTARTLSFAAVCAIAASVAPASLLAADPLPQKTCAQLLTAGSDDERKAAEDGRWGKSNIGAIFRTALINARTHKRISVQCTAEGRAADARQASLDLQSDIADNYPLFIEFMGYRQALSDLEEKRFDKQVGGDSSGAGTTSVTSKGTVPSLIGFAVENGALTRSVSGTTVTVRAVPWNVVKALADHGYLESAPTPQPGTLAGILSEISTGVSFDTSRGNNSGVFTGDKQQISGYSLRYQILNWRDPRNIRYAQAWNELRTGRGQILANRVNEFNNLIRTGSATAPAPPTVPAFVKLFQDWRDETLKRLQDASLDDLEKVISEQAAKFKTLAENTPEVTVRAKQLGDALADYFVNRNDRIKQITKSSTLAFEYTNTKQANTNGATTVTATGVTPAALPDLSNLRLIYNRGFKDGPEFTFNASFTLFSNLPAGSTVGTLRDAQAALQLDVPLPEIAKTTGMVLSFAGQFVSLREEPLGAQVIINTKPVSTKGNIGLGQAKLTIPVKGSGVQIPISVTWSNRTELILEKDVRANIGVTFDLDKLFAKP